MRSILFSFCCFLALVGCDDPAGPSDVTPRAISVAAGSDHTCAVLESGKAYCWGSNQFGQLGSDGETSGCGAGGDPSTWCSPEPVEVRANIAFRSVEAGTWFSCGLTSDERAFCWGSSAAALGIGMADRSQRVPAPAEVAGGLRFRQLEAGGMTACGLTESDQAYCWGSDTHAQIGTGSVGMPFFSSVPTAVTGGHTFGSISVIVGQTCALTLDGAAFCWGADPDGADTCPTGPRGGSPCTPFPVRVDTDQRFREIWAGRGESCGLTANGDQYCWPHGGAAALVTREPKLWRYAQGESFRCGLTEQGSAFCWGGNFEGELGIGTTTSSDVPAAVEGDLRFSQISAGSSHACGVTINGEIYCWGRNGAGQLGVPPQETAGGCGAFSCSRTPRLVTIPAE